jgi:uncharacterized membrane protein (DUF2068 family)
MTMVKVRTDPTIREQSASDSAVLVLEDAGTLGRVGDTKTGGASGDRDERVLGLIGAFKLLKTAILVTLGVIALEGGHERIAHSLAHATHWTGVFSGREIVQRGLARLLSLDDQTIHRLGIASLVYATVFATEGLGLLARRRWAEWFTVGTTSSFIPLEIYELIRHPGMGKVVALIVNLAIVAYLLLSLRATRRSKNER